MAYQSASFMNSNVAHAEGDYGPSSHCQVPPPVLPQQTNVLTRSDASVPPTGAPSTYDTLPKMNCTLMPTSLVSASSEAPASSRVSSKNMATLRKVNALLDIPLDQAFTGLVQFIEDTAPETLRDGASASNGSLNYGTSGVESGTRPSLHSSRNPGKCAPDVTAPHKTPSGHVMTSAAGVDTSHLTLAPPTSATLRASLEGRMIDMHVGFLHEFASLYNTFKEAAGRVQELQQNCTALENTLGEQSGQIESFVTELGKLQAELHMVRQREREMREFKELYNFGPEEQHVLENDPVSPAYLDVLERAQAVQKKCRSLLFSRDHHESTGAVMESTYAAIMVATEKIARYLLSFSLPRSAGSGAANATTLTSGSSHAAMAANVVAMSGDAPTVSHFFLRCAHVLQEENITQWEKVVEEVTRLRRAAVLRRYFHLLITGSVTTMTGTYRSGDSCTHSAVGDRAGTRPLEAELNNPVFFFSSLFAWCHQTIVEECDFLALFWSDTFSQRGPAKTRLNLKGLLDDIFSGLCKYILTTLDGILERFVRTATALKNNKESEVEQNVSESGGTHGNGAGIRQGLSRLFSAAMGRSSLLGDATSSAVQRYGSVTTRAQQEALVASSLSGMFHGLKTIFQLIQLFEYYNAATFSPLLGNTAALTQLVQNALHAQLFPVFQTFVGLVSRHILDSVTGATSRVAVLRRLSSAAATNETEQAASPIGQPVEQPPPTSGEGAPLHLLTSRSNSRSRWVLDFLLAYGVGGSIGAPSGLHPGSERNLSIDYADTSVEQSSRTENLPFQHFLAQGALTPMANSLSSMPSGTNKAHYSSNNDQKQRAGAYELIHALSQLILPPSPELQCCLRLLDEMTREMSKRQELIAAIHDKNQLGCVQTPRDLKDNDDGGSTSVASCLSSPQCDVFLMETLMNFEGLLSEQSILLNSLDEPCRMVMELNVYRSLQSVLPEAVQLSQGSSSHTQSAEPNSRAIHNVMPVLTERINQRRAALISHLQVASAKHYFPSLALTLGTSVNHPIQDVHVHALLAQLYDFYGLIASIGHVPPLPLIAALIDKELCRELQCVVDEFLCRLYEQLYSEMEVLVVVQEGHSQSSVLLTKEQTSVFNDIAPQKLYLLMDKK